MTLFFALLLLILISQSQAFSTSRSFGRMHASATLSPHKVRLSQLYLLDSDDDDNDDEYDEGDITTMTATTDASTRDLGEKLIMDAVALTCGDDVDRTVTIEWKGRGGSPRIIVTVDTSDDDVDYNEDDYDNDADDIVDNWDGNEDDNDDDDEFLDDIDEDDDLRADEDSSVDDEVSTSGNLLTRIARAINEAFARDAPDGPGYSIAKIYDIEVTTPPFDGVLRGRRMFDSYRGFDVVVEHYEKEKKSKKNGSVEVGMEEPRKLKTSEGKLDTRDNEADGNTTINSKGRAVKIKNEDIVTVRLPKAKREKGVR